LGRPSSSDARAELATWLWDRQLFEIRANETVVKVVRPTTVAAPRSRRMAATVFAASLAALAAASTQYVDYREMLAPWVTLPPIELPRPLALLGRGAEEAPSTPPGPGADPKP
jgi:hypothetical protein